MNKKEEQKIKGKSSAKKIGQTDEFLIVFFRQLAQMISVGMPIYRSLKIIDNQFAGTRFKPVIEGIIHEIYQEGRPLNKAMAKFPSVFSQVVTASIKASEEGGFLPQTLQKIAEEQEKSNAFKKRIFSILTYPIFVMIFSLIALIIILKFILPAFTPLLRSFKVETPLPAKMLNEFVAALNNPLMLAALVLLAVLFLNFIKTQKGGIIFQNLLLELPIIGVLMRYTAIVRFSRMYALLSSTGYPMVKSLQLISASLGINYYEKIINKAAAEVADGALLSEALANQRVFPTVMVSMISVGEETGDMKRLLGRLAYIYEAETESMMEKFFALIEPLMLIFLGFIVGFLLISVFLPVYSIMMKTGL